MQQNGAKECSRMEQKNGAEWSRRLSGKQCVHCAMARAQYCKLHPAPFCSILLHSAPHCSILPRTIPICSILLHSALFCPVLLHSAPFLSIPLHSAPFRSTLLHSAPFCGPILHICDCAQYVYSLLSLSRDRRKGSSRLLSNHWHRTASNDSERHGQCGSLDQQDKCKCSTESGTSRLTIGGVTNTNPRASAWHSLYSRGLTRASSC
jgi:hypothetical protein